MSRYFRIGCGLDTTFSRIDNRKLLFYELDLPDVIALRKNFYQDSQRHKSIASSFLEPTWFENILVRDGLLFLAGGVLMYFEEEQIRKFFIAVPGHFGVCDFYFDSLSPTGMKMAKKAVLKKGDMGMNDTGEQLGVEVPLICWKYGIRVQGDETRSSPGA